VKASNLTSFKIFNYERIDGSDTGKKRKTTTVGRTYRRIRGGVGVVKEENSPRLIVRTKSITGMNVGTFQYGNLIWTLVRRKLRERRSCGRQRAVGGYCQQDEKPAVGPHLNEKRGISATVA
jgi:hypothetical protein